MLLSILTNSSSHVVSVWVEISLLVSGSLSDMVMRVLNHILRILNVLLLVVSLKDVHVRVVLQMIVHFNKILFV